MTCPVCGGLGGETYEVLERMFGTGERFKYSQCSQCGVRWLLEVPDMAPYYPPSYVAFSPGRWGRIGSWILRVRDTGYFRWNPAGMTRWLKPEPLFSALRRMKPSFADRIVDVGCGNGTELHKLAAVGFRSLTGIDLFVPDSEAGAHNDGVTIHKRGVEDFSEQGIADIVVASHVLEHVTDARGFVRGLARLLAPGGRCLLRTPIANSWAADQYGAFWVQHDAPRHVVLHTEQSVQLVAEQAGLRITSVWYDSSAFQFWGSEAYVQGRSLKATNADRRAHLARTLWCDVRDDRRAAVLNHERRGDQACFVLMARE